MLDMVSSGVKEIIHAFRASGRRFSFRPTMPRTSMRSQHIVERTGPRSRDAGASTSRRSAVEFTSSTEGKGGPLVARPSRRRDHPALGFTRPRAAPTRWCCASGGIDRAEAIHAPSQAARERALANFKRRPSVSSQRTSQPEDRRRIDFSRRQLRSCPKSPRLTPHNRSDRTRPGAW